MAGMILGNGRNCPRCFCENSLKAEANAKGIIGVVIECVHCNKTWTGGWSAVERTRRAMSQPGYIENTLHTELQKLINIASADALDGVVAGIDLALMSRQEELDSIREFTGSDRYRELTTQIKTLTDMKSWVSTLKEGYEKK